MLNIRDENKAEKSHNEKVDEKLGLTWAVLTWDHKQNKPQMDILQPNSTSSCVFVVLLLSGKYMAQDCDNYFYDQQN